MARVAERSSLTAAEYLAWEREQEQRHEFFYGEVFAMAGGSARHNYLGARVITFLGSGSSTRGCKVFTSDQRVGMFGERYVYPDITVVCGSAVFEPRTNDVLANPTIIVEVLSASTEQYDRGLKWVGYQRIASLTDYVLVSQSEPRIEHFRREREESWIYRAAGPGERITLTNGTELGVDAIFEGAFDLPGD